MNQKWWLVVTLSLFVAVALPSRADEETQRDPAAKSDDGGDFIIEKKDGKTIKYKKKTTYDFEGASIEGLYNKPSGSYISNIKDVKGKSILKIRESFDAEVLDSARLVK